MTTLNGATTGSWHAGAAPEAALRRRLMPLYLSSWILGIDFWVPVEKLFLKHIGFTAGTIGLLAATYAVVVPFLEIPSGILADRWSRRGVLMIANGALGLSSLVGGLSANIPMYLGAALLLGVYFAMHSGTVDSIVYDVLLEETGSSDGFERILGRLQVGQSVAFVFSAIVGGVLAQLWSLRVTYFLTIPFILISIAILGSLREPQLHRAHEAAPLRRQVATTYRTFIAARNLRPIIVTMVLAGVLLQSLLEFGPLWMVAIGAPAILFGPQWASLMSAQGLGGILAPRVSLEGWSLVGVVGALLASALTMVASSNAILLIVAQVVLAVVLVAISTVAMRRLHDGIPSAIRSGVSSGVSTVQWMVFLPFSVSFGFLIQAAGIHLAAWMLVSVTALLGLSLVRLVVNPSTVDSTEDSENIDQDFTPSHNQEPAIALTGC